MGKKDKNKKKGRGTEKTASKTEKKINIKQKKALMAIGEDDIEKILLEIEYEEQKRTTVTEIKVDFPTRRCNFTFVPHPDKDELVLFGGEFYNGKKTQVYNDLFFYNTNQNSWSLLQCPSGPSPRCGHQMAVSSANNGQLWLFGGEFTSPTQSQFYHYNDLWVYHISKRKWEKIAAVNGPSARSGHRMVYFRKQLIVFGGFNDNLRNYKYFNDVHVFNTENYKWQKIEPAGTPPDARSGCCMVALPDGKILIYGGYRKERIKKDVDKGHIFTDAFLLAPFGNDASGLKWKWVQTKIGGICVSARCGMPITAASGGVAYTFGGVYDVEDEENLTSSFFDDLYCMDLGKLRWHTVQIMDKEKKKCRRNKNADDMDKEITKSMDTNIPKFQTVSDDGVFTVTVGPSENLSKTNSSTFSTYENLNLFWPTPRMNAGLAIKYSVLYVFGGIYEDGNRQLTLNDFYALDLKKMNQWKIIAKDNQFHEWLESASASSTSSSGSTDNESSTDEDEETPMETE
ncbi:kelch domain-containing protein 4 [Agrilus planipennis]|uniref:Kelch domain-containing protein 4 n=1 Tax=Agrilus planipennis TaxID=224129 RepID=A0A1W4XF88_AGRPL|nr:kelch domain-containing protein 4 [Agrilus planipennis]